MKFNLIFSLLLLAIPNFLEAQNTVIGGNQPEYVKYDAAAEKTDKPIPFDKPFKLELSDIEVTEHNDLLVFEIGYKNGLKYYKDVGSCCSRTRASFVIPKDNIKYEKNKIIIPFPALKPEKDFRLQLRLGFSGSSLHQLLYITKLLNENYYSTAAGLTSDQNVLYYYKALQTKMNQIPKGDLKKIALLPLSIDAFRAQYYLPVKDHYKSLLDTTPHNADLTFTSFLTQTEITAISLKLTDKDLLKTKVGALQKICDDDQFALILNGQLPISYKDVTKVTYSYQLDQRLVNLNQSLTFLDSLNTDLNTLKSRDPLTFDAIKTNAQHVYKALADNQRKISSRIDEVKNVITSNLTVGLNNLFGGSTVTPDFQTAGKRHVTLEAGVMDILAYNNSSSVKHLWKPSIGITYHLRSIDKTVNLKKITPPPSPDDTYSHSLESRYNFWFRLGVTAGVTLGSMNNKDFDNVYNSLSFTLGPSYQIVDGLRISTGAALLKRVNNNPLMSNKSTILGGYASLSLDYDLLEVAKSVTSMIFK